MTKVKIITRRINNFLTQPQFQAHIYNHLNSFKNGTTPNQLNNVLRRKHFKLNDEGKWEKITGDIEI